MSEKLRYREGIKVTWIGIVTNIVLTTVKAVAGVLAGSTAMVADAFHSASDIAGSIVVLGGLVLASRPPDAGHHYGHAKFESVVAKLIALLLIFTGGGIGWAAIGVLREGDVAIPGALALYAAAISIIVKEGMFQYTVRVGRRPPRPGAVASRQNGRAG
jgi:cation diffusion facilitator family transporter